MDQPALIPRGANTPAESGVMYYARKNAWDDDRIMINADTTPRRSPRSVAGDCTVTAPSVVLASGLLAAGPNRLAASDHSGRRQARRLFSPGDDARRHDPRAMWHSAVEMEVGVDRLH